ncbi:efflux RND transporter periplasmic adaptor subunit [Halomonas korlensis]|uniref:Membrane fusion protein, multidrug efflux system n=1 Tax=Halomonas korlensis TaxID=463301 RepID=A0A1I7FJ18_9GAMM|nr:efflux RND transporter periplasmic adaptor subunit [Halomonas korlensis]SFU36203.1 membrane fusion protein, multidrug efflux system [Halomonas korlensis]
MPLIPHLVRRPVLIRFQDTLAAALLIVLGLLAQPLAAQEPTAVIGARASLEPWSDPIEGLGTLSADESVTLSTTVTEIIRELNFQDGDTVEAGRLLVRLADDEEQADLRAAQALRDERRNAVNRLAQLQERNLAPRAEVEDSRARLRQVEAEIQALEARLDNYQLRAPFDGRVGFRNVSVGALVTPGMDLVTLDKLDVMKLDFTIPEVTLGLLEPGLTLTAHSAAYPEQVFAGKVASIGTRVDPVSRSVTVRAELDNPELHLRPGMLMRVVVRRPPRETLVLPESVLIPEGQRQYVLVLHEDEAYRVERRQVKLGARREGEVEIVEGLESGDLVVAHGTDRVRDGQQARLLGIMEEGTTVADILSRERDPAEADS